MEVLHEDNHTIVINKRSGDIVQGDKTGDEPVSERIKRYLKEKYKKPGNVFCGVVHRLDRPTTGALLFARTSKALSRLNDQFRTKDVEKIYWAVVENMPPKESDTLVHYLQRNEKQNKSYAHLKEVPNSKKAMLHYTLIAKSDNYFLLEIKLETGRHHQIRSQLSSIGCCIKGDLKYGAKRSNKDGSIHLHARRLSFDHPTTKERIVVEAPVPADKLWQEISKKIEAIH
ncbi:MAG: RNA pseudouridine synthase [Bacteroidetes bacterium]|nr:MAG: RNA pseudouridine synthase [Bacteroidota bacterium]TNE98054.1 MAG: RNA pseudouridine synthase [Bacteroidota bacterium]